MFHSFHYFFHQCFNKYYAVFIMWYIKVSCVWQVPVVYQWQVPQRVSVHMFGYATFAPLTLGKWFLHLIVGVLTEKDLPSRQRFGPYEGTISNNRRQARISGYNWEVRWMVMSDCLGPRQSVFFLHRIAYSSSMVNFYILDADEWCVALWLIIFKLRFHLKWHLNSVSGVLFFHIYFEFFFVTDQEGSTRTSPRDWWRLEP